jgi:hypothetical protein
VVAGLAEDAGSAFTRGQQALVARSCMRGLTLRMALQCCSGDGFLQMTVDAQTGASSGVGDELHVDREHSNGKSTAARS